MGKANLGAVDDTIADTFDEGEEGAVGWVEDVLGGFRLEMLVDGKAMWGLIAYHKNVGHCVSFIRDRSSTQQSFPGCAQCSRNPKQQRVKNVNRRSSRPSSLHWCRSLVTRHWEAWFWCFVGKTRSYRGCGMAAVGNRDPKSLARRDGTCEIECLVRSGTRDRQIDELCITGHSQNGTL